MVGTLKMCADALHVLIHGDSRGEGTEEQAPAPLSAVAAERALLEVTLAMTAYRLSKVGDALLAERTGFHLVYLLKESITRTTHQLRVVPRGLL